MQVTIRSRPCVVVSPGDMHDHLRTVIVAPMRITGRHAPVRMAVMHGGQKGLILLDQRPAVDKGAAAARRPTQSTGAPSAPTAGGRTEAVCGGLRRACSGATPLHCLAMSMTNAIQVPRRMLCACVVAAAWAFAAPPAHAGLWSHWTEVKGSGHMVHSTPPVEGGAVTGLTLHTGATVHIRQGDRDAVEIDADDNVLPLIQLRRDGSTLIVDDSAHFASDKARVTVTVRHLSALSASGSSSIVADGLISPVLAIQLGGSSDLRLNGVTAERIGLHTGGSSEVTMQGVCNDLALNLGGSSAIKAGRLEARNVTLSAGGSSQVTVWAKLALTGAMGGSSELRYYGVKQATLATGGSSSVERLGDAP